ncbi:hypothetical protein F4804DRAFT_67547 [Jackrogersella minutella]|nr:hypothetical protein F4804DRAFT_67547 [Jackrogersella minutella]
MDYKAPYEEISNAIAYDFVAEISPGVWRICRKTDRIEFLAHDVTRKLYRDPSQSAEEYETALQFLLESERANMMNPMMEILNHENLVCLVDWFTVQRSENGRDPEPRTYSVWDFCDAGNLGNLLVRPQKKYRRSRPIRDEEWDEPDYDNSEDEIAAKFEKMKKERGENKFLPESFCWHVLISVLKSLAWLHDGSRQMILRTDGSYDMTPNENWEPILHRNITPNNIFLAHPRRNEWYGSCKLGNYNRLYITNHYHGDYNKPPTERTRSKALAPPTAVDYVPLENLVELDAKLGHLYPQQPNQPCTQVTDWRALGEILQAMMVTPHLDSSHVASMREKMPKENLEPLDYTVLLKNTVLYLMTVNPDQKSKEGHFIWSDFQRQYMTSIICVQAFTAFQQWRTSGNAEGQQMLLVEDEIFNQVWEDREERKIEALSIQAVQDVLDSQDKNV